MRSKCRICGEEIPKKPGRGGHNRVYCDRCHPIRARVKHRKALQEYRQAITAQIRNTHKRIKQRAEQSPDNTVRRICQAPTCGTEFAYTSSHARLYCNETCRENRNGNIRTLKETVPCEQCGTTILKYGSGATLSRPRRFCSPACKSALHARVKAHALRARDQAAYTANPRSCLQCSEELPYRRREKERCGSCQREHERRHQRLYHQHRYETDHEYRARCIDAAHRRHARKKTNGPVHNIKRLDVFKRDNYRCRICGVTTDESLPRYHPRRPELGHINAIAAGGTHTWDNVCCLCHACNRADGVNQLQIQTSIFDLT
jgi:hypothetical protein